MGGWHLAHSLYRCLRTLLTSTLPGVHPGCHPLSPFTHVSLPLDQRLHTTKHDLPAIAPYTGFGGPNPLRCRLLTQPNACTTTSTVVVCPSSSPLLAPQTPTPDALLRLQVIYLSPGTYSVSLYRWSLWAYLEPLAPPSLRWVLAHSSSQAHSAHGHPGPCSSFR